MKLATIELIKTIKPHANADRLELAQVLGFTCVVPKDKYKVDDLVIFIQPDTVLPNHPWTEFYKKFSKNRVKAARLRGEWSYGIVESLDLLPDGLEVNEGMEVADLLEIIPSKDVDWCSQGVFTSFNLGLLAESKYIDCVKPFVHKIIHGNNLAQTYCLIELNNIFKSLMNR